MKCSFCGKKMRPGAENCPECGLKVQLAETEKKRFNWKLPVFISSGVIALLLVAGLVLNQLGLLTFGGDKLIDFNFNQKVEENLNHKDSYTKAEAISKKEAKTAIAAVGDKRLDNGTLQFYYAMEVIDFLNNNAEYLSYLNLDLNKPLSEQYVDEDKTITWEQRFLENAINDWYEYAVFNILAEQEGYTISEGTQKAIANFENELQTLAESKGFMNAQLLLNNDFGEGYELKYYIRYLEDRYTAVDYVRHLYENKKYTQEEIEAYYTENEQTLLDYGISKDMGYYGDVRHILVMPKGGTTGADNVTVYSEEEWANCEAEAQRILDLWLAGAATEETFAQLAVQYSEDTGSSADGGRYPTVREGQMVEEFDYWLFFMNHEYGDYDIIRTSYGYHIMYFVGLNEIWAVDTGSLMMDEWLNGIANEGKEVWPITRAYDKVILNDLKLL